LSVLSQPKVYRVPGPSQSRTHDSRSLEYEFAQVCHTLAHRHLLLRGSNRYTMYTLRSGSKALGSPIAPRYTYEHQCKATWVWCRRLSVRGPG